MDELGTALAAALPAEGDGPVLPKTSASGDGTTGRADESSKSQHSHLYKLKKSLGQEHRRKELLELQKSRRSQQVNDLRQISSDSDSGGEAKEDDEMECSPSARVRPRFYKNKLMLSEWLLEVPADLQDNWMILLCPVGKRSLVVSSRGRTLSYTKSGFRVSSFPSLLPGGNRSFHNTSTDYCVLDCIYSEADRTYYVLDVLSWKGHPVVNSETEFRFYWLQVKLDEGRDVMSHSRLNPFRFVSVTSYKNADLERVLCAPPPYAVDGLLFYHRRTHYTAGSTPLVGWLKVYMVPEHLGIPVADTYMVERPEGYVSMREHLHEAYSSRGGDMITEEIDVTE